VAHEVLETPEELTPDASAEICAHLVDAARLIARVPGLAGTAAVVLAARERADGSGYPYGLTRAEIPIESCVVGMCEAYLALRSRRPWRDAYDRAGALDVIRAGRGFDADVVGAVAEAATLLD
jgi:HD-GYP domain-containing protein (c-di-GMP phosphodiesterase class II)